MAVTIDRRGFFNKTGEGFYALTDPKDDSKPLINIGYLEEKGQIQTKWAIVEPDPVLVAVFQSEFSAFLTTVYKAGFNIAGDTTKFNLTDIMVEKGLIDFSTMQAGSSPEDWKDAFLQIFVLDVMALLGAVAYDVSKHIRTPNNPNPPERPKVWEVPQLDRTNMLDVIKFLGLWGILHHLYIERGLNWEEYKFCILSFFPDLEDRRAYINKITYVLRYNNVMLGFKQLQEIGL